MSRQVAASGPIDWGLRGGGRDVLLRWSRKAAVVGWLEWGRFEEMNELVMVSAIA